jgi:integrase/recombinase XerD
MKLSTAVDIYVQTKRDQGLHYAYTAAILDRFVRHVRNKHLNLIKEAHTSSFISNGNTSSDNTWISRYRLVRAFLEYWRLRGQMKTLPLPPRRREIPRTFLPYIYTRDELRRILRATPRTRRYTRVTSVDSFTLRTFLRFLYGTGILLNEALALQCSDVDLKKDLLTLRRIGKSRCIPMGRDVHNLLRDYLYSPVRRRQHNARLFLNVGGEPIGYKALWYQFRRMCRCAGVARRDGRYQPRMCDLRFTFVVHRLTSWYKQGTDVERMLIPLSEYLGETGLDSMEKYLGLTPERFRRQLHYLSPGAPTAYHYIPVCSNESKYADIALRSSSTIPRQK